MNKKIAIISAILLLSTLVMSVQIQDQGQKRLKKLRQLSVESSNGIIKFTATDYKSLTPQYQYLAHLYHSQGASKAEGNQVFFISMNFGRQTQPIFQQFNFKTIPNLVVSKSQMPLISQIQKKVYLQKFKWAISYSDGDVTTHKMLDFVNQRTKHNVFYKPTVKTMFIMFFGFIGIMTIGVLVYTKLKFIWTHWLCWLIGVMLIYITCVSGVVYDIIHNVPFVGRDKNTGQPVIFTDGNRQQYGAQGLIISLIIASIGGLFVSIVISQKNGKFGRIWSLIALVFIVILTNSLQSIYKTKSWYGPSFYPPNDYSIGSIMKDQGNNI